MFLMMAEVLELRRVAKDVPESDFWKFLAWHQSHVEWAGCSLHDLIQPSFSFLVGVALAVFDRQPRRQGAIAVADDAAHAVWRACFWCCWASSCGRCRRTQTNLTFEDTLSQIGLGYVPLFLLGFTQQRWQWAGAGGDSRRLLGAFALYPLPAPDFDYQSGRRARRTGRITTAASPRTGTRTATWPGRSTPGF